MTAGPLVIVGDALLDRDTQGRAERLSPDAPVPVIEDTASRPRPGGAALAAFLAAAAGGEVVLVAPFGTDPASDLVRALLPGNVTVVPVPLSGTLQEKTRLRAGGRTLLRVDTGGGTPGPAGPAAQAAVAAAGTLLVCDYGRGATADHGLRAALSRRGARVPLVWDPHPRGSPPVPGTRLATPNLTEAAGLAGQPGGGSPGQVIRAAAAAAEHLLTVWRAGSVAVTLGAQGALLATAGQPPQVVPARPIDAGDPCGAGDQFAAAAALALRGGALLPEAVEAGVSAATAYLAAGGASGLVLSPAGQDGQEAETTGDPAGMVAAVRARGGTVVAAGGCFDVLHAGHVSMLQAARSLGDCLVVCLNSDASVRRLKGPGRPLNAAADRASVLSALGCVDAVVVFGEDTPEAVLRGLRPHIWVKGGDYDGQRLPEAAALREWGGRVITVPYLPGRSTSGLAGAAASAARQAAGRPSRRALSRPAVPPAARA
jgi:D-beta-D-heptose 7-phosphate kinase / D-beta-D-heptose 1-phosphate adenosyltransferase